MEVIDDSQQTETIINSHSGKIGIMVGNQQFTIRNLTVNNAETGEWKV